MEQHLLFIIYGTVLSLMYIINLLVKFKKRKIKKKNWEEDKLLLFFLLAQSIIFLSTIIVNSVYRPSSYTIILIEYIINLSIFILTFLESLNRRKISAIVASTTILLIFFFI
ncbi:MAG: hypothetical protein NZ929_06540 [Aigarchaeota archaeon]|nr:hypothetical protein [Aigarchaeota archaeon]MCX8192404.1 hypothetical protein [Nitrososphaeria archaeon]MDW7986610.1 hypothetical protein [Nitrososphaerota archaeon]